MQKELLLCGGDRATLLGILRRTRELDLTVEADEPLRAVRLLPFVEELCLAASFYLLPLEKSIGIINPFGDAAALLPVRKTERDFFFITSRLFKRNKRINARFIQSDEAIGLAFEADNPILSYSPSFPLLRDFSLLVKNDGITPVLRFKKTDLPADGCPADFSLLMCDKMSELNKWYFDIE